jgi:hypothetical protein
MTSSWEAYCYEPDGSLFLIETGTFDHCLDQLCETLLTVNERAKGNAAYALRKDEAGDVLIELQGRELRRAGRAFWRSAYGATWGVRQVTRPGMSKRT